MSETRYPNFGHTLKATKYTVPTYNGFVVVPADESNEEGWGEPFRDDQGNEIVPGTAGGPNPAVLLVYKDGNWKKIRNKYWQVAANIDWIGPVRNPTAPENKRTRFVVTCHGPQQRYVNDGTFIYGNEETHHDIYMDGQYLGVAPYPVLGAALAEETVPDDADPSKLVKKKFVVAVCTDGGVDVVLAKEFTGLVRADRVDADKRAQLMTYYDPQQNPYGWRLLFAGSRATGAYDAEVPWFFDPTGKKATTYRRTDFTFDSGDGDTNQDVMIKHSLTVNLKSYSANIEVRDSPTFPPFSQKEKKTVYAYSNSTETYAGVNFGFVTVNSENRTVRVDFTINENNTTAHVIAEDYNSKGEMLLVFVECRVKRFDAMGLSARDLYVQEDDGVSTLVYKGFKFAGFDVGSPTFSTNVYTMHTQWSETNPMPNYSKDTWIEDTMAVSVTNQSTLESYILVELGRSAITQYRADAPAGSQAMVGYFKNAHDWFLHRAYAVDTGLWIGDDYDARSFTDINSLPERYVQNIPDGYTYPNSTWQIRYGYPVFMHASGKAHVCYSEAYMHQFRKASPEELGAGGLPRAVDPFLYPRARPFRACEVVDYAIMANYENGGIWPRLLREQAQFGEPDKSKTFSEKNTQLWADDDETPIDYFTFLCYNGIKLAAANFYNNEYGAPGFAWDFVAEPTGQVEIERFTYTGEWNEDTKDNSTLLPHYRMGFDVWVGAPVAHRGVYATVPDEEVTEEERTFSDENTAAYTPGIANEHLPDHRPETKMHPDYPYWSLPGFWKLFRDEEKKRNQMERTQIAVSVNREVIGSFRYTDIETKEQKNAVFMYPTGDPLSIVGYGEYFKKVGVV